MKKLLFLAAICVSNFLYSQSNTKMDYFLAAKQQDYKSKKTDGNRMLPMLIQGKISAIKQLVEKNGGIFKYSYGNIAAIVIPVSALSLFNESGAVTRMEGGTHHNVLCTDTMRLRNSIVAVQQGLSPLPQAYKGKGIVMGFIDTGIDYTHPDFIDSAGKTRVLYYWDQNQSFNALYTPLPYGYGQAWDSAEINAGLASNTASTSDAGHGTNVAGVGASNGRANRTCIGGAPESDIIYVALDFNSSDPNTITDAANYIYTMAESLNEPCVINASLGSYDGSHDGQDLQALMLDSIILAKQPGRVFVASAGNVGGVPFHVHDSLTGAGDTTFTWFKYDGGYGIADIPIFANETDFNNIKFRIRCDKVQPGGYTERDTLTVYSDISHYMGIINNTNIYNANGQVLGVVSSYGQVYGNNNYSLEFQITPDSTSYYWGFEATGTGRYDIWDYGTINGVIDSTGLSINHSYYPEIAKYKNPDTLETICSSFQCSPDVIVVANYYNRKCWIDYDTALYCLAGYVPGAINGGSSRGPTRNYTLYKPDIGGAGGAMMTAMPVSFKASYIANDRNSIDTGAWHDFDGGTSMAAPGVASVAALYMERYPKATYLDVWNAITTCDSVDGFTGSVPNYRFGYGKVDAFKALTGCSPAAIEDISPPSNNTSTLKAYPNPEIFGATIAYDFSSIKNYNKAQIVFYDMLGKEVKSISIKGNQGTIAVGESNLSSGIYFYSLIVDGSRLKTEKLEIL